MPITLFENVQKDVILTEMISQPRPLRLRFAFLVSVELRSECKSGSNHPQVRTHDLILMVCTGSNPNQLTKSHMFSHELYTENTYIKERIDIMQRKEKKEEKRKNDFFWIRTPDFWTFFYFLLH